MSTRIVLAVGFIVNLLSWGVSWLAAGGGHDPYYSYPLGFPLPTLFSPQRVPVNIASINYPTYATSAASSLVSGNPILLAALVAFALSLIVGVAAFFRWQLSLVSGALAMFAVVSWLAGVVAIAHNVAAALDKWPGWLGTNPGIGVGAAAGPYVLSVGGVILISTYVLTRIGKLNRPD